MTYNDLDLPAGAVMKGAIPPGQSELELVADMIEVDLPDGTTIEVGWVPEHNPSGSYRLVVFRDWWANKEESPLFTRSREQVIELVRAIARQRILKSRDVQRADAEQTSISSIEESILDRSANYLFKDVTAGSPVGA
jgi:hypothetical protein